MTTCPETDKVIYRSERAAKKAARSLVNNNRAGLGLLRPYRCGGHWHVGHGGKRWQNRPGKRFR